jgi:glutamate N-acetyltransferase/amino-acid N-acetyltransferase
MAQEVAQQLGLEEREVLVCSTGLIGEPLPMAAVSHGIKAAVAQLSSEGGDDAAQAILTTDTRPKQVQARVETPQGAYTSGGMAKGAGMLAPELATMLVVLTTDAQLTPAVAQSALEQACERSFNRTDSDGCMSTNDTVILLASGASGYQPDPAEFTAHLTELAQDLALQLVADAEGASHEVAVTVRGAHSEAAAVVVARAVARSNLFKTAIAGNDPNWGRILSAAGTVPAAQAPFDPSQVDVAVNGVTVSRGGGVGDSRELVDLAPRQVQVEIDLHAGSEQATVWTNDLTHAYVSINADYSS